MAHLPETNGAEPTAAGTLRSANNIGQQHEPSSEVGHVVSGEVFATHSTVQGRSKGSKDNTFGKLPEGKRLTAEAGEDAPSLDPIGKLVSAETRRLLDPQLAKSLGLSGNSAEETVKNSGAGQVRSTDTISDSTSGAAPESGVDTLAHGVVGGRIDKRETIQAPALVWQRSSQGTAAPRALGHPRAYSDETVQFFRHRPEQTAARVSGAKLQSPTREAVTQTQSLRRVESGMSRENMTDGASPPQIGDKIVSAQAFPIRSDQLTQRIQPTGSVLSPVLDDGAPEPLEAGIDMLSGEVRSSGSAFQAPAGTAFHRTETATSVLRQMIEGITTAPGTGDDVIELQLRPEELGHLRFRMVQGEHGLLLSISADRPETLDLLRRHVDQLARSLSDLGYGGASFSFGEGGQSNGRGGEAGRGMATDHTVPIDRYQDIETPKTTARGVAPSDGLDIRI
ncbi:flagellar hook-length control protein FliK [Salipiger thiooxidans]|uniref:flagellar hook-length control protein FliK n=1 Tax=Salipiger thiooxidans TaxID=282683 RepID=UPI001A8C21B1|nr:flagellar hook-length control protein FliK [Salipiger thiooxidans]MBN8185070.1 flagellar hook-length control protein FliK [Salipiger thiooxidans]